MEYALAGFPENLWGQQVTIAAGASESEAIPTGGRALVAIVMPGAWTAALIGIKAGLTPAALGVVYDNADNLALVKTAASRFLSVPLDNAVFAPYISVVSVAANGSATNQEAARTLILLFRRYLGGQ
jgi:hypothetical protein